MRGNTGPLYFEGEYEMSCDECNCDPVLALIEELADARGLKLVPKEPQPNRIDEFTQQIEELPTPALLGLYQDLESNRLAAAKREREWQVAYKAKSDSMKGFSLPGYRSYEPLPVPPELSGRQATLERKLDAVRGLLGQRYAQETLDEVKAQAFIEAAPTGQTAG